MNITKEVMKCPFCTGYGTMLGLGMLERKCKACNGIGYSEMDIENNDPIPKNISDEEMAGVLLSRKRGRPAKKKL